MAAADRTNNTEQLQRFINNLWGHQQKNEFCDFTLTTNNTSIECHKLVLSSASSYFSQLLCASEHNTNIIDVTPLPGNILRTVVAFMYNSDYVIDDENVIELLKLSRTWNLDILAKLCVTYMNDIVTINNACMLYSFALDNVDQHKPHIVNKFIREHFTALHESGQLSVLSLKNFITIIEHDEINVKNEDVIFSSAVQIINQRTSVEDINRCLELIRFPHTSGDFLVKVIRNHPLMKEPPRDNYVSDALLHNLKKTSKPEVKPLRRQWRSYKVIETATPEIIPPRYWGKGIYYIGQDCCMYQYASQVGKNKCVKMIDLPKWVSDGSSLASHKRCVVIVGGKNDGYGLADDKRALLLNMTDNTKVTQLPDLPEPRYNPGVVLSDTDVYVVGEFTGQGGRISSVYYLSLGSVTWQKKKSILHRINSPLVMQHQECIYVLGGVENRNVRQSSVLQYNIKDDTWNQCSDMPVACASDVAGVVVHENRIKVITVDKCLIYADDTDTWTVKQYSKLGDRVNAFVMSGEIWAAVQSGNGTCSMMSYDDLVNRWKTEFLIDYERRTKLLTWSMSNY